jgi:hypothetical protein
VLVMGGLGVTMELAQTVPFAICQGKLSVTVPFVIRAMGLTIQEIIKVSLCSIVKGQEGQAYAKVY